MGLKLWNGWDVREEEAGVRRRNAIVRRDKDKASSVETMVFSCFSTARQWTTYFYYHEQRTPTHQIQIPVSTEKEPKLALPTLLTNRACKPSKQPPSSQCRTHNLQPPSSPPPSPPTPDTPTSFSSNMQTTRPTVPACLARGLLISVAGKRGGEVVFAGGGRL